MTIKFRNKEPAKISLAFNFPCSVRVELNEKCFHENVSWSSSPAKRCEFLIILKKLKFKHTLNFNKMFYLLWRVIENLQLRTPYEPKNYLTFVLEGWPDTQDNLATWLTLAFWVLFRIWPSPFLSEMLFFLQSPFDFLWHIWVINFQLIDLPKMSLCFPLPPSLSTYLIDGNLM